MEDQQITLARAAYDRYGAVTDYKNFQGNPMPKWEELPEKIQQAWVAAANPMPTVDSINNQIGILLGGEDEQGNDLSAGEVRDGYHSFNELYDHRIGIFIALAKKVDELDRRPDSNPSTVEYHKRAVWRSKAHSDGSVWPGWFLLGIGVTPGYQITYHLPLTRWDECEFADTRSKAPDFDGHTSADVLTRLKTL